MSRRRKSRIDPIGIIALVLLIAIAINPELLWAFGRWFTDTFSPMFMLPVSATPTL